MCLERTIASRRVPYDDDYETCERTCAKLLIYPESMDPDLVTERLGIRPTQVNKKGALRPTFRGERPWPLNAWFLSSEGEVSSRDVRRHLDWLLARLVAAGDELRALQQQDGIRMSITCIWWSAHGDGGPTLWPEQMKLMAELGLECCFELAFYGDEEDE